VPELDVACRALLVTIFAVAAAGKLRGPAAFAEFRATVRAMGVHQPRLAALVARLVPVAEAAAVVLLVPSGTVLIGYGLGLLLLLGFTGGIALTLRRGRVVRCRCFGAGGSPVSVRHLVRNTLLALTTVAGAGGHLASGGTLPGPLSLLLATAGGALAATALIRLDDLVYLFGRPAETTTAAGR
jgi:hypothetical protein